MNRLGLDLRPELHRLVVFLEIYQPRVPTLQFLGIAPLTCKRKWEAIAWAKVLFRVEGRLPRTDELTIWPVALVPADFHHEVLVVLMEELVDRAIEIREDKTSYSVAERHVLEGQIGTL